MLFFTITSYSLMALAAKPLDGYVVMANNDTIQCKIRDGRFLNNPFGGITIINEEGEELSFRAKDKKIIAFGFIENFKRYHYKFIEAGEKNDQGFYQLLVNGPKYKLYSRVGLVQGEGITYVLFNPSGEFVKFQPSLLNPWKKQLRDLLKDDPHALKAVEEAKLSTNMSLFVMDLNKEYVPEIP